MLYITNGARVALRNMHVIRGRHTDAPGEELYGGVAVAGAGLWVLGASVTMEAVRIASCTCIATDGSRALTAVGSGVAIAAGGSAVFIGCHIDSCAVFAGADVLLAGGGGIAVIDLVPTPRSATLLGCTISNCSSVGGELTVRAPLHAPTAAPAHPAQRGMASACRARRVWWGEGERARRALAVRAPHAAPRL